MSQKSKLINVAQGQTRKRNISSLKVDLTGEPSKKRGRPSKTTPPAPANTYKKSKTMPKVEQPTKELTPVTPTDSPPSADVVFKTTYNKKTKKAQQHNTVRRSNPHREVRNGAKTMQSQNSVATTSNQKPPPKPRMRLQGKQNRRKSNEQSHFQPVVDVDEDVDSIMDDLKNNNVKDSLHLLKEKMCRNRTTCESEVY